MREDLTSNNDLSYFETNLSFYCTFKDQSVIYATHTETDKVTIFKYFNEVWVKQHLWYTNLLNKCNTMNWKKLNEFKLGTMNEKNDLVSSRL